MKNPKIMMAILAGVVALTVQGYGQSMFQVKFKGTAQTTNDSGNIVSTKLNNDTFIRDAVTATGATNSSGLQVVYVQNASTDPSVPGDFIEVVDNSGTSVYTNLIFLYTSLNPALTNADGTQVVIGAQVIPLPLAGSGESLGGATINERFMTKKTIIQGSFNYVMLRSPGSVVNDTVNVVSGSFSVNKPFMPH